MAGRQYPHVTRCFAGVLIALMLGSMSLPVAHAADKWRHGVVEAKADSGFLFMAAKGGFAAKRGLDVEMVQFVSGTTPLKALIAGELDSFEASPVVAFGALVQGADVKFIGCHWPGMTYTLYGQPTIKTLAELKGKAIGVSAPGSLPALFAREVLADAGLKENDVVFANAGGSADRVKAVITKVVAAAASSSEFEPGAKQRGLTILAEGTDASPKFVKVCMMSTARKIKQKREIMTRFLAASMEAHQYSLTHRDETIKLTREVANLPASDPTAPFIYDQTVSTKAIHPDLSIPAEDLQWTEDMMVRNGALSKPQPVKNFIDDSVRIEALKLVSGN